MSYTKSWNLVGHLLVVIVILAMADLVIYLH